MLVSCQSAAGNRRCQVEQCYVHIRLKIRDTFTRPIDRESIPVRGRWQWWGWGGGGRAKGQGERTCVRSVAVVGLGRGACPGAGRAYLCEVGGGGGVGAGGMPRGRESLPV